MTLNPYASETAPAKAFPVSTGGGGTCTHVVPLLVIFVSGALSVSGTSSAEESRLWEELHVHESEVTASGPAWKQHAQTTGDAEITRQAISELRRISGLTWEQLGELFDVSRRSVHFWASGKPMNAGNQKQLMQILDIVRAADRGDARSTRAALFEMKKGSTAFALLTAERFEDARATLDVGTARPRPALAELSTAAKAARKPLPPEDLVEAQNDRVHSDPRRARAARTVKKTRRGKS